MTIFVNRILNMKHIKAIGFDMDYTLVRYNVEAFEQFAYEEIKKKLILFKNYPESLQNLTFDPKQTIRGLVVDKKNGNLIKLSLWGKIKTSFHGTRKLDFKTQQHYYQGQYVDLNDSNYACIDTSFSIAYGCLYAQLVDLRDKISPNDEESVLPSYEVMESDVLEMMDLSHRDGSLKTEVAKNLSKYIVPDPNTVKTLERLRSYGKRLLVVTNSEFEYTKTLLDETITPHLTQYKNWQELFEVTVTSSSKPRFFTDNLKFLKIDPETGYMSNLNGDVTPGVYQGGCAKTLQESLGLKGEEILYLGDHIYGDILTLKKTCNWRTALVVEELSDELQALEESSETIKRIDSLMANKVVLEREIDELYAKEHEYGETVSKEEVQGSFREVEKIDQELAKLIGKYNSSFNPNWGEVMRAGQEESRFAGQIQKYACIYMSKVSDLYDYSPRTYFRPPKRSLPHEID